MKVYGIYISEGDSYGLISPLYQSINKAREAALDMVSEHQKQVEEMQEFLKDEDDLDNDYVNWIEQDKNRWCGGYLGNDEVEIREVEII